MSMSISTVAGHVSRAIDFYNNQNVYFGIGKSTSWSSDSTPNSSALTDDDNPPEPLPTDTVQEIIGYKKVASKFLVYPDSQGQIACNGRKWKICTDLTKAVELGARWIYLASWLLYDELPTYTSYRQIGVYSGLVKKADVAEGKTALLPTEVESPGVLQAIYHRKPVYRDDAQREQLISIITF